jgi:hypothetical protein
MSQHHWLLDAARFVAWFYAVTITPPLSVLVVLHLRARRRR